MFISGYVVRTIGPPNTHPTHSHPALPGGLVCAIGNPLNDGKWHYEWVNGRQLTRVYSVYTDASFVYNENGLRVRKTVNGLVTNYTLHGKNIVHMTQGSNNLHFFYDAQNKSAIVEYNGTRYAYVHNLQGDIVAILDGNGTAVVQYKYDAWGRPISKTGSMAGTLGTVQPFRYRGYVYDEETGMYYLRSRFFTYGFCRFVNADTLVSANTYAYCGNNPICYSDENGYERTPDYTRMLNSELDRIIAFTDPNLFIQDAPNDSISFAVANLPTYLYLFNTMQDGDQFDYKESAVWSERFPGATVGANGEYFIFRGLKMTSEDFGNYAYGYYCTALGIPKLHTLAAAGAYKVGKKLAKAADMTFTEYIKTREGINRILDVIYESEMGKSGRGLMYPNEWLGGNDPNDHEWIVKGIYAYMNDISN